MTLIEPDVALTDFALAAECALFAGWLHWGASRRSPLLHWFVTLFAALGVGALLGGVTHGFLADTGSVAYRSAWIATLVAIALAALSSWAIGAHSLFAPRATRWFVAVAAALFAINVAWVVWIDQSFLVAIAFYAPAVLFALVAFVLAYSRCRATMLLPAVAGVVLSLVAAAIQQGGTGLPSLNLSHNALYHLVQAVGLALIFVTARRLANGATA